MKTVRSLRKVLVNAPVYAVGDILQSGTGLLLLPVYTRFLEPREYGGAVLSILVARLAAGLFTLHIQAAVVRFTYDAPEDREYMRQLYGTVFAFTTLLSLIFLAIGASLVYPIMSVFGVSGFWLPYAYVTIVIAVTVSSYDILQRIMQAHQQSHRYVAQQWLHFLLGASVTLVLMVGFQVGGLSIVMGLGVTSVCFYVYSLVYIGRHYGISWNRSLLKNCLAYSVALLPNRYAGLLPRIADRLFLASVSVGAAGIYSVGFRIGEGVSFFSGGFFRAHLPWFYATMKDGGASGLRQIVHVGRVAILVIALFAIVVSLFAEEAIGLTLGSAYHEVWKVVPLAAFVVVFTSIKDLWLRPITYEKRAVRYVPFATYAFAGLSIGLMAWMVPAFGILGAAGAILAARFFSSFVMLFISLRVRRVGYPVLELYAVALVAFGLASVAYLPIESLLPIKLAIAFVSVGFVTALRRKELLWGLRLALRRTSAAAS